MQALQNRAAGLNRNQACANPIPGQRNVVLTDGRVWQRDGAAVRLPIVAARGDACSTGIASGVGIAHRKVTAARRIVASRRIVAGATHSARAGTTQNKQ